MSYLIDFGATTGSGLIARGLAAEALGDRKLIYVNSVGSWNLADADTTATMPMIGITLEPISIGMYGQILITGAIGLSTWTWTPGGKVYASTVAGELTQTAPTAVGTVVQAIGIATTATMIYVDPKLDIDASGFVCPILEGATAYVGFDECKEPLTNYFYCDGTADDVQINQAIAYIVALGGGRISLERGVYDISDTVEMYDNTELEGLGWDTVLSRSFYGLNEFVIANEDQAVGNVNIRIANLQVDGNTAGTQAGEHAIDLKKVTGAIVEEVYAHSGGCCRIVYGGCIDSYIINCYVVDTDGDHGITLFDSCINCVVEGCVATGATSAGISVEGNGTYRTTVSHCISYSNTISGFLENGANHTTYNGCIAYGNTTHGFYTVNSVDPIISGCHSADNGAGATITGGDAMISGSFFFSNDTYGIHLNGGNNTTITGCKVDGSGWVDIGSEAATDDNVIVGNNIGGINISTAGSDYNLINDNNVRAGTITIQGAGNEVDGNLVTTITITAGAGNIIGHNPGVTTLNDGGTSTVLPSKSFQFIQGTTFISADGSAKGWEINAEADMAVALGQLPLEVQQVVRIKIWAVALGAPGAGGQMLLDIVIQAGADDLAYTTENINLAAFESVTTDYVANDVVHWSMDTTDDADIGDLAAGMSVECKINGAPVSAPDEATNATFRVLEIEYV